MNPKKKKKVLVIVVHPDDETIWMGGLLLSNKNNWDTTIISLCRKNDTDRASKFKKVCDKLKAKSFMSDLDDEKMFKVNSNEIIKHIEKFADKNYDYVFTHGQNGEYGHQRHIETHFAVDKMIKLKKLQCNTLFFFDYKKVRESCTPTTKPDKFINLNSIVLKEKRELVHNEYEFKKRSFEFKCCKSTESFKVIKIK